MTRIADLLDRDLSRPVDETVNVNNGDPNTVLRELTEYVATDRIRAAYEGLFSAMAAKCSGGVWISGAYGSGKSSFAKNVGYVLANREVSGIRASSLFLKQVESTQLAESVEVLNRAVPYQVFMFDVPSELAAQAGAEQIAEVMYRVVLRDLDYAEDYEISELEIELEREGKLTAFQDLCRAEYGEEWRSIRGGNQGFARASTLLHRLDPGTYSTTTDRWLNLLQARRSGRLSVQELVEKSFDLCARRRPGKAFAFIMDGIGQYIWSDSGCLLDLCVVVEQFGKEGLKRLQAGRIPGLVWIVVTAEEEPQEVCGKLAAGRIAMGEQFRHVIHLGPADIGEAAARCMLRKKGSQEAVLRKLFQECGAALIQNVRLEQSSHRTEFDEDQFVRYYPYLPHLIELSIDILDNLQRYPDAPMHLGNNRTIIRQCFEMLVSEQTRMADQPIGALVSLDRIYELVEANIPWEKQKNILDIRKRYDDEDYPGMAVRVAKAICLMEFAEGDLPRTTNNIAALLVQRVTEAPPAAAVAMVLYRLKAGRFVLETENGWKLHELDELRRAAAGLEALRKAIGTVNPRPAGWYNAPIQVIKKLLARSMSWYTRPINEFNASVTKTLEGTVCAIDQLFKNAVTLDHLYMKMTSLGHMAVNLAALEGRLARAEKMSAAMARSVEEQLARLQGQVRTLAAGRTIGMEASLDKQVSQSYRIDIDVDPANERTAYLLGLFGTGRWYLNELILKNIGARSKNFRDSIRLHAGPTPMIYSGHVTLKHVSSAHEMPEVMTGILEAIRSGFADSIFIYRHPLDSLLTNWVCWRTQVRDSRSITGISQIYKSTDELCADLDRNFAEFAAFAEGSLDSLWGVAGARFLSFAEFVEETELHRQSATLAVRLEDFAVDPRKEFSKIAEVMSVDIDPNRSRIIPPRTSSYRYLAVKEKVARFRNFIDELNPDVKSAIERIGYEI